MGWASVASVLVAGLVWGCSEARTGSERSGPDGGSSASPPGFSWAQLPLQRTVELFRADRNAWLAFAPYVRQHAPVARCVQGWRPPPKVPWLEMTVELRLRGGKDEVHVEDAAVLESNPADRELERCILGGFRGLKVPAPGITEGHAFRVAWPIGWTLE